MMEISNEAERGAQSIVEGFVAHDKESYGKAQSAFAEADKILFDVDDQVAMRAASGYTEALYEKDRLEQRADDLADADWDAVHDGFLRRASALSIDPRYAVHSTNAWRNHKTGKDYWTELLTAQTYVVDAATPDGYDPKAGSDAPHGYGPLPSLYLVGVEAHDMHSRRGVELGTAALALFYEHILSLRG